MAELRSELRLHAFPKHQWPTTAYCDAARNILIQKEVFRIRKPVFGFRIDAEAKIEFLLRVKGTEGL